MHRQTYYLDSACDNAKLKAIRSEFYTVYSVVEPASRRHCDEAFSALIDKNNWLGTAHACIRLCICRIMLADE